MGETRLVFIFREWPFPPAGPRRASHRPRHTGRSAAAPRVLTCRGRLVGRRLQTTHRVVHGVTEVPRLAVDAAQVDTGVHRLPVSDDRCQMSDVKCQMSDVRCQMSDVVYLGNGPGDCGQLLRVVRDPQAGTFPQFKEGADCTSAYTVYVYLGTAGSIVFKFGV